jgi:hypothetical protein
MPIVGEQYEVQHQKKGWYLVTGPNGFFAEMLLGASMAGAKWRLFSIVRLILGLPLLLVNLRAKRWLTFEAFQFTPSVSNAAQMVASITTVNTTKTIAKSMWLDFMGLILARRGRLELVGSYVKSHSRPKSVWKWHRAAIRFRHGRKPFEIRHRSALVARTSSFQRQVTMIVVNRPFALKRPEGLWALWRDRRLTQLQVVAMTVN